MQRSGTHVSALFGLWTIAILVMFTSCGSGNTQNQDQQTVGTDVIPIVQATERVVAEGEVVPVQYADIRFEISGNVAELLVQEGSTVQKGDPIARIDTRDLMLAVEEAKANLASSKADYDKLLEGATQEEVEIQEATVKSYEAQLDSSHAALEATKAQVAGAEAQVAKAQAMLNQTIGQVTDADIAAAQANIEQARLALADLEDGPKTTDVQASQSAIDQATADLQQARDSLSAAKTSAYLNMQEAANQLRDVQANYSSLYWDNREIERDWDAVNLDLPQKHKDQEESMLRSLRNAESRLEETRTAYEQAKQNEITGVQAAEARLRQLQAQHADLINGSDADEIAAARYRLHQAEAELERMQGQKRSGDIASAQASVIDAQAGLQQMGAMVQQSQASVMRSEAELERSQADLRSLLADPRTSDVNKRMAVVSLSDVALKKATLMLDKATLVAPFDGTVVEIVPKEGEWFGTTQVAATIGNLDEWVIETTDLDELNIVHVRVGSIAHISFDALPDLEIPGKVTEIQSLGKNYQGDIVYKVTITPNQWDERLRWKMTATVSIEPIEPAENVDSVETEPQ